MAEGTEKVSILRITDTERVETDDVVATEFPLTIILNGQELVTMLCSPDKMKYLAIGFLASEGLINTRADIKKVLADERQGIVRVETESATPIDTGAIFKRFITSGCGKGTTFYSVADANKQSKVESKTMISADQVFALMRGFRQRSELFRDTGGVHSAALSDGETILVFSDDVGRHNAVDKIFGECLWEEIPTRDRIILTSGRISSEVLFKTARAAIPIIISKSAPTNIAIRTASNLGITLIGFVRGKRMNIYANSWRISNGQTPQSADNDDAENQTALKY
ncbi:MAG: formate dehydrogenase accessory sulfurtransferase FdhD [Dehalococcoidia bacterium]|nr:formate dehydrogenase accessory sulfurtransferase FdhD [Dehalococcoidia bacterium]